MLIAVIIGSLALGGGLAYVLNGVSTFCNDLEKGQQEFDEWYN